MSYEIYLSLVRPRQSPIHSFVSLQQPPRHHSQFRSLTTFVIESDEACEEDRRGGDPKGGAGVPFASRLRSSIKGEATSVCRRGRLRFSRRQDRSCFLILLDRSQSTAVVVDRLSSRSSLAATALEPRQDIPPRPPHQPRTSVNDVRHRE